MDILSSQFKQRHSSDRDDLHHALESVYIGITGDESARTFSAVEHAQGAIAKILAYYDAKPASPLKEECRIETLLEHHFSSTGIAFRQVKLPRNWHKDAMGPYLGQTKDGTLIALLPKRHGGYSYTNPETGKETTVTTESLGRDFTDTAYCFYRPLPNKELGIADLIAFVLKSLDPSDYTIMVGASIGATLLGCLLPILNKFAFGPVIESGLTSILLPVGIMLLSVTVVQILIGAVQNLVLQRVTIKMSNSIDTALMMRLMNLPASFFKQHSTGSLASRFYSASFISSRLSTVLFGTALSCLFSLTYIFQMLAFAPQMAFPALSIVLITALANIVIAYLTTKRTKTILELNADRAGLESAMISGIQKIRLAGAETRFFSQWAELYAQMAKLSYGQPGILIASTPITLFLSTLGFGILCLVAINGGVNGDVATYMAFSSAFGLTSAAFANVNTMMAEIFSIQPHMEMLEPILKTVPESTSSKTHVGKLKGSITLKNVTFSYDQASKPLFENLSFEITPGEYVGIVGKTGCGKSTILRLILGFETPSKGIIVFDNYNIANVDVKSIRKNMGIVLQNGSLINGSIFDNIAISTPGLTLEKAWEAAELVGLADDIRAMPMGMNTYVSAQGSDFSGGQRQRMMIARAIAGDPKILLFDEATSALDNITQKHVSDSLARLECTRIVIAHRLSTIKDCDRILVIDEGRVAESGSYDELMEQNGIFTDLVSRQLT